MILRITFGESSGPFDFHKQTLNKPKEQDFKRKEAF